MNQPKKPSPAVFSQPAAILRIAGLFVLGGFLATCTSDSPSEPSNGLVLATLAFTPVYPAGGHFVGANLTIDHIHAVIVRPPSTTIKDTTTAFDPNLDQLKFKVPVLLQAVAESLDVTLELLSGTQVLFSGTTRLEVQAGSPGGSTPPPIPLVFTGPGAQLAQLILAPADSMLSQGDKLPMRVSGLDAGQTIVPAFYVSWSSSDTTVAKVNGAGVVAGRVPRGVVYVRARTPATTAFPQGIVESTTVTLVPTPAAVAKVSGDNQTALAGQALAQPLVIKVTASDQLGVVGVPVTFTPPAGGSVQPTTTLTDAAGLAQTTATLPPSASGQVQFTAKAGALAAVTFTATALNPSTPVWTGTVSTDWSVAGNWNTGSVPTATDDVTIPNTTNHPTVTATSSVHDLSVLAAATVTISPGLQLTVGGNLALSGTITCPNCNLTVLGSVTTQPGSTLGPSVLAVAGTLSVSGTYAVSNNTLFTGINQLIPAGLPYSNIAVSGTASLTGRTSNGLNAFNIFGAGKLTLNGHTLSTGLLQIGQGPGETATLVMNNALDSVITTNATFNAGSTAATLTSGVILVAGNFNQLNLNSPQAFSPSGTNKVVLNGTGLQTVHLSQPSAANSHFQNLDVSKATGGVSFTSDVPVLGQLVSRPGGASPILHGTGVLLTANAVDASGLVLDTMPLSLTGTITTFDNVIFQNQNPTAIQLTVSGPGSVGSFVFNNLQFLTTPTTGFYLSATDVDGPAPNALTLDLVNPTPATPGGFAQTSGGAVINWPAIPTPVRTWTGTVSNDWSTAGNWSPALVPTSADDVTIPSGTPNSPTILSVSPTIRDITMQSGATLGLGGHALTVLGNIDALGTISGGSIFANGNGKTVRGIMPTVATTIDGTYTLSGAATFSNITVDFSGRLTMNGNSLSSVTGFNTAQSGVLVMNQPLDTLVVVQDITFGGGDETGLLTAGGIVVTGQFTQISTNSTKSFAASGTLGVGFIGATSQTIDFQSPGPGLSGFADLGIGNSAGGVTLASNIYIQGRTAVLGGAPRIVHGQGHTIRFGLLQVNQFTFDNALINSTNGSIVQFDNITFQNYLTSATVLTIANPGAGSPHTFNNVVFQTTPTTGAYIDATDNVADANVLTIDMVNPTPGTPGAFVRTAGGAVVNWPGGPVPTTWTGAVSTDWFVAGNWSTGVVPNNTSAVLIPQGTPNQPVTLTNVATIGSLTVNGNLDIAGFDLTVFGDVLGTGNMLNSAGPANLVMSVGGSTLSLTTIPALRSNGGMVTLTGAVIVAGDVAIAGNGGLDIGGQAMTVGGNFSVVGAGALLRMTSQASVLNIIGTVTFDGADETGKLTAGVLAAGGDFTVLGNNSPTAFQATALHEVVFSNATGPQTISMVNPGIPGNHFGFVALNTPGSFTLQGMPLLIEGGFSSPGVGSVVHGNGFRIQAAYTVVHGLTLDNAPLQIVSTTVTPGLTLDSVTFQNMNTAVDQLEVILPGASTPYVFNHLVFNTTPVTGFYLFASDNTADANVLTLNLVNPTPATPGSFVTTAGGAVVNWPSAGGIAIDWTGAISTDWSNPGNWNGGFVPSASDSVQIATRANQPVLTTATAVGAVEIVSGGHLTMNGQSLTVARSFRTSGTGVVTMQSSADQLIVGGDAVFDGGDETGLLTNGNMNVRGDFTQANTTSKSSFAASGNHTVVLDGTVQQTVTMPDSVLSHFGNLLITNTTGVTLASLAGVQTALTLGANAQVTATDLSFNGTGFSVAGTVFTAAGSLLNTGRLYVSGTLTVNGTFNETSVIFTGTGQTAPSNLPYQYIYSTGTVTFAPGVLTVGPQLAVDGGTLTLSGRTTINGDILLRAGTLKPNGHTVVALGAIFIQTTGTISMQNALDSVLVSGAAIFGGGSESGLMTAGVLKIGGSFSQTASTSNTSFAPSGSHKTLLGSGGVRVVNFATPGTGATGSHFADLDVTAALGGLTLLNNIVADGALISQPVGTAPTITGAGKTVTAMSLAVTAAGTSLILDDVPVIVNEQGTIRSQQFDRSVFQNFPTGPTSAVLLDMTGVGAALSPRLMTFNGTTVQTSLGSGGLYAKLTSSNGLGLTLTINGSNDPTGGPSRSNPPFGNTVNGARIIWQ